MFGTRAAYTIFNTLFARVTLPVALLLDLIDRITTYLLVLSICADYNTSANVYPGVVIRIRGPCRHPTANERW